VPVLNSMGDNEAQSGTKCRNFWPLFYLTSIADHFPPLLQFAFNRG